MTVNLSKKRFPILQVPGIADEDIDKLNEDFHEMLKLDKIREKYNIKENISSTEQIGYYRKSPSF